MARRTTRTVYRCGGYASYSGHCGGTDCETCYPGCSSEDPYAEEIAELDSAIDSVSCRLEELYEKAETEGFDALSDEGRAVLVEIDKLSADLKAMRADLHAAYDGSSARDDGFREPDAYDDDRTDDNAEVDW